MEVKNNRNIFLVKTFSPSAFHIFTKTYCSYSNSGLNTFFWRKVALILMDEDVDFLTETEFKVVL